MQRRVALIRAGRIVAGEGIIKVKPNQKIQVSTTKSFGGRGGRGGGDRDRGGRSGFNDRGRGAPRGGRGGSSKGGGSVT